MGAVMFNAAEQLKSDEPLALKTNPFCPSSGAPPAGRSVQIALGEVITQIELKRTVIIIAGRAGTGKTLLMDRIFHACSDMGLSVRQVDRGDLADTSIGAQSDVLLVDEADSIPDSAVRRLLSSDQNNAGTTRVLLCLPSSVHRFVCPDANVVELRGLSASDARDYLLERANSIGNPDLFAPDALDLIILRARGSPRLLRSIASLAFFDARREGKIQIDVGHVAYALTSQMTDLDEGDATPQAEVLDDEEANYSRTKHGPEGQPSPITRVMMGGRASLEHVVRQFVGRGPVRLAGVTAAIVGCLGLVAGNFELHESDNSTVGRSVLVPIVPTLVTTTTTIEERIEAPARPAVSPAGQPTPAEVTAAPPPAVNAPAAKAAAASRNANPNLARQARAATKGAGSPPPRSNLPSLKPPQSSPTSLVNQSTAPEVVVAQQTAEQMRDAEEVAREAEEAARQAEEVARQAEEAALQAKQAALQADVAARDAEEAARQADEAAREAEEAVRQAGGIRFRFPWQRP